MSPKTNIVLLYVVLLENIKSCTLEIFCLDYLCTIKSNGNDVLKREMHDIYPVRFNALLVSDSQRKLYDRTTADKLPCELTDPDIVFKLSFEVVIAS